MANATAFTMPSRKLTWLITGASSGFGLSLARYAQAAGHKVIASSRNPTKTPHLVSEFESKGGKWIKLDVTDPDSAKVIDRLEAQGDNIDVLVNNAGFTFFTPVETATEKETRSQMETLYFGPIRIIQALLPYQRSRKFGIIVNISSGASLDGAPTMGTYAGPKAALDACTKVLGKEIAPFNIRTLTVILGTFNTSFNLNSSLGERTIPDGYQGTIVDNFVGYIKADKVPINGDKDKAMKALYEVVSGTGVGDGKESERLLLLGPDMIPRATGVSEYLNHAVETFGTVAENCKIDK